MTTIRDYVEGLFRDVPESLDKESITQEIILNLEEKVQDLMEQGKTEEDAINKSIVEFGDANEIKNDLMESATGIPGKKHNRKHKANYTNALWFSIWGTILIISLFLFINLYYTPTVIWFVYPVFVVLWWPLALFFRWLNNRKKG
jgi:hypothetical protein